MPFFVSWMYPTGLMYSLVLAEFHKPSSVFVQMVNSIWADHAGRRLLILLTNSSIEISHDENHLAARYLVNRMFKFELETIGGFGGCFLSGLWVYWCAYRYQCDFKRVGTETACDGPFVYRFPC